ncbi:MAG: ABC transporter substrate-binding protein [Acidisphaera sp.]|nr:ABC transporter substrate-binding protein [Acidisphaera sp.]
MRAIALLLALAAPARAAERVVSLNLCTDQMLVLLAPEKVAGLTPLARDPALSYVAAQAAGLPVVRPSAEAVLGRRPDLVLATSFAAQTTLALLEQSGLTVLRVGLPADFPVIRAQTRHLAAALGVAERGEALIARMDATLALAAPRLPPVRAVLWGARGYAAGPGTLGDAVLRAAGLEDAGAGGRLDLEALVAHPPDLLVVPTAPRFPSLATALLDHPATSGITRVAIPPALLICGGPFTARAVRLLAEPPGR